MSCVTWSRYATCAAALVAIVLVVGCAPPPEQPTGDEAGTPPAPPQVTIQTAPVTPPTMEKPAVTAPESTPAEEAPALSPPANEVPQADAPAAESASPPAMTAPAEPAKEEAKPADDKPAADKPEADKPEADKPEADKPEADKPEADKPEASAEKSASAAAVVKPAAGGDKVSAYAPAEDLVAQLDEYVKDIEDAVANEADFGDNQQGLANDASTVVLISLALGLHDSDNKYKQAAPAIYQAASKLVEAKDYAAAKAAAGEVKKALESKGDAGSLKWEDAKVASLPALMKEVPLINSRLGRYIRKGSEDRLKRSADDVAGNAAVIAVIGQGSIPLASQTSKPDEADKWAAFCVDMRDAAAKLNTGVRTFTKDGSAEAFTAVMDAKDKLTPKSCDDCHAVFHQEQLGKSSQ